MIGQGMKNIIALLFLTITAESLDYVTFRWEVTPIAGVDHFEAELIRDGSNVVYPYSTKETTLAVKGMKPGLYQFQFRSCMDSNCAVSAQWCNSTNPLCVEGGQAFKLQFNLSKPILRIIP